MNNKHKLWINILLIILLLFLGWKLLFIKKPQKLFILNNNQPNYQINNTISYIHNMFGQIVYKLITKNIYHFSNNKNTWFTDLKLIIFDKKNIPTMIIYNQKAKLIKNNKLFLYGTVIAKTLNSNTYFQYIITKDAVIDLITHEFYSNKETVIHGINFTTRGMKIYANLKNYIIKLTNNVQTSYDIKDHLY
uniref:Lipopolysaccharide export system protein LptC n=1 Tax=Candidatus Aschnera chinzeii TaxID=1485666 RepID=A0AAT9G589_9ENTR|nr:MAG: hypothetical protein ACHINZ_5780 [Candidatus Aschnera chinzeii]